MPAARDQFRSEYPERYVNENHRSRAGETKTPMRLFNGYLTIKAREELTD
jgi:hypothetical protein